jgi:hypothetical protein
VAVSLRALLVEYGRTWIIDEGSGGGWYAVRRVDLSDHYRRRGLSNVRGGRNLAELERHLAEETRLEGTAWARPPLRRAV